MSRDGLCANCGTIVAGRFCGNCGQRFENPVHALSHFLSEATEDLTHADSRLWRTIVALLFKPGFLTREFLDGRRVSYLPPIRLYLVLSLVFFVSVAAWGPHFYLVGVQEKGDGTKQFVAREIAAPSAGTASEAAAPPGNASVGTDAHTPAGTKTCAGMTYQGPWQVTIQEALRRACLRSQEDHGKSLQEAFLHAIPRAMFVFLPLLALVMMTLYWRPRHFYVEHLLLFIHNHAFVFLALTLFWGMHAIVPQGWPDVSLTLLLLAYIGWYIYRSMRRVYGQTRWVTLAKLGVIALAYFASALVVLIATTLYSVISI